MTSSAVQKLKTWYGARPLREKRILLTGGWVVVIGLALQLNDWALNQRSMLTNQLAGRQHDLVWMQAQADELQRLSAVRNRPVTSSVSPEAAIAETAASRGLVFSVDSTANGFAVLASGHADQIIDWLAALHADHRLNVAQLELTANGSQLELSARLVVSAGARSARGA